MRIGFWLALAVVTLALVVAVDAQADELDDVNAELDARVAELEKITERVDKSGNEVAALEDEIAGLLDDIGERQAKRTELQQRILLVSKVIYKSSDQLNIANIVAGSESLSDIVDRMEIRYKVLSEYVRLADEQERISAELEASYQNVSKQKDKQEEKLAKLRAQRDELDEAVAALKSRSEELTAAQQAALAAAAEAEARALAAQAEAAPEPEPAPAEKKDESSSKSGKKAKQEESEPEPEPEPEATTVDTGWQTGVASAYGGSSDDSVGADDPTATGNTVDDYSMGVAVPIAWGPEAYYGRSVEITYNGVTVVATVTDCGGMGDGARALDLQPGVFRAFGFSTCDDWGVREVQYRFL